MTRLSVEASRRALALACSEESIQDVCVGWLRANGYRVLQTGRQRQKGVNDRGTPDLLVWHADWGFGAGWLGIELKNAKGRPSAEQAELIAAGAVFLCRSLEDVQRVLTEVTR